MGINAERNGTKWVMTTDPIVIREGRMIRKIRIDELHYFNPVGADLVGNYTTEDGTGVRDYMCS